MLRSGVAAAALLLACLGPAAAHAAPTWLPPSTISAAGEENTPIDVATAPDGTVVAVWQRAECTGSAETHSCANGRVQYSIRPPGGSFSPATDVPGEPFSTVTSRPRVAVDAAGNALVAWVGGNPASPRVRYALRPAGGAFGGAKEIADPGAESHSFPSIAAAPDGRAVVTFSRQIGGNNRLGFAVRAPGGDFGPAATIAGDTGTLINSSPRVQLDASGGGIATWARSSPEGVQLGYATIEPGATEFSAGTTIEKGSHHDLALAPSGAAVLIWNVSGSAEDMRYAFRPPGGAFGPPQTLVEPDSPLGPQVAIAPDGSVVAAWASLLAPDSFIRWTTAPFGGSFGPPIPLQADNEGFLGDLEISDQGMALLLWTSTSGAEWEMRAALRPAGGAFAPSTPLPGPPEAGRASAAAFDAEGNAVALWNGHDAEGPGSHDVPVLAAGLDGAGPRILGLDVPATARDDRAVTVGISAFDVWTSVASTGFNFGDGTTGPGPFASHRFLAGTRTVTGFATDAVGNVSTATAQVVVKDVTRPVIRGLRVSPRRFWALPPRRATASRRHGARIRFHLSERARVIFTVQKAKRGVRVRVEGKRRCLRPTPRNLRRGGKRCARFVKVRRTVRKARRGRNSVKLPGRFRGRRLTPGRYRVVAVAVDPVKRRSKPARTGFRVRGR